MLRVTADSNIYISALNFGGVPDQFLELARGGEIRVAISKPILDEVCRVLELKFGWTEQAVQQARAQISWFTSLADPQDHIEAITDDPTDNRVLECAVADQSEFIVTGDRHLLSLGRFASVRILKPADFFKLFSERDRSS